MKHFVDININNKVIGVKTVKDTYVNPGNSIEMSQNNTRLMGTTYKGNGIFEGYYITLETDKPQISADGADTSSITAKVYNYLDELQESFGDIIFEADGVQDIAPVVNGIAQTTFKTSKTGEFKVVTKNTTDIIRNGEVIISAE